MQLLCGTEIADIGKYCIKCIDLIAIVITQEKVRMIITALLFIFLASLIVRLTRHGASGLTTSEVWAAFGFKVLMACSYGYLFLHFYGGDDTWKFHSAGLHEYQLLVNKPGEFFWEFTPVTAWRNAGGHVWLAFQLYLTDLEYCLVAKTLGIFNIISRGHYYENAVFFSFLTFWGHYWLFRLVAGIFPQKRKVLFLLIFFFPPVVFWLSGIRSDGLIFLFLCLLLLHGYQWIHQHKKGSLLYVLLGLAGVLIFRDTMLLLLLPALIGWFIVVRYDRPPLAVFGTVYGVAILLFWGSAYFPGGANLPSVIANRQQEFLALKGNTRFQLDVLQPTAKSFLQVLPQAVSNTFLRPFVWEARGMLQVMAALEILLFWALVILGFVRREKNGPAFKGYALLWVLLFFSVSLYIFIGYVTPFPGAIVRYKIIPELFLLILLVVRVPRIKLLLRGG
jgi:hypothetical protein